MKTTQTKIKWIAALDWERGLPAFNAITIAGLLLAVSACNSYHPPSIDDMFPPYATKAAIHARLGEPMSACDANEVTESSPNSLSKYIALANEEIVGTIQSCEVYSTPRTSTWGLYFDYVAYDANDQVIHSHRRFLD